MIVGLLCVTICFMPRASFPDVLSLFFAATRMLPSNETGPQSEDGILNNLEHLMQTKDGVLAKVREMVQKIDQKQNALQTGAVMPTQIQDSKETGKLCWVSVKWTLDDAARQQGYRVPDGSERFAMLRWQSLFELQNYIADQLEVEPCRIQLKDPTTGRHLDYSTRIEDVLKVLVGVEPKPASCVIL